MSGTASQNLYGMCESLWEPDLEPEDLFETISQALLNAQDRDALSGWGAVVHIMYVTRYIGFFWLIELCTNASINPERQTRS